MASAVKSFLVSCPFCGCEDEDNLTVDLNDLTVIKCGSCGDAFTPAAAVKRAAARLRRWRAVARWIEEAAVCLHACGPAEGED